MRLSSRGSHAIKAMMNLALSNRKKPVTLAEPSQENFISISYLEQLFARLREGGLVSGVRGPGGGYVLARPADQITMGDIILAVDEKGAKKEDDQGKTHIDVMWNDLSNKFYGFLDEITLAETIANAPEEGAASSASSNKEFSSTH